VSADRFRRFTGDDRRVNARMAAAVGALDDAVFYDDRDALLRARA